jgi:hypothetical protein
MTPVALFSQDFTGMNAHPGDFRLRFATKRSAKALSAAAETPWLGA